MGSTGSGRFSDYSNSSNPKETQSPSSGGVTGGTSGIDKCRQAFSCTLEEVAQCAYFSANQTVPSIRTSLGIVLEGRLFAVDLNGVKIGALPTKLNYLAGCIKSGVVYVGYITASKNTPFPTIDADFVAQ